MLSTLFVLSTLAQAHDEQPQEAEPAGCPQCLYEELAVDYESKRERGPDTDWDLYGTAGMVYLPGGATPWAMAGVAGLRGIYAHVEGRAHPAAKWMGRAGAGFDFLPRQETVDVTVGMYFGNAAVWNTLEARTTQIGTELGLGVNIDRTRAKVRWLGGPNSQTGKLRRETIWSLGYRVFKPIEIQAQAITLNPGTTDGRKQSGFGLAGALVF
ncbi:MAG: hypothetical protein ACI8PZ_003168 [Myxococcota bacterium]|jgi:hypothetical protein